MAKHRLFLLDTVVIVVLHELGAWEQVLSACEVTLTESVVGETLHYFRDGEKVYIDLAATDRRTDSRLLT